MHIAEGALSAPILAAGAALALPGLIIGIKKLDLNQVAIASVMAAAFFVGSLVHVPIGIANAHLLLVGLIGVILGWAAIPAIFVALVLQALLFQYGGLTTLGVNTCSMGYGAAAAWLAFRWLEKALPGHSGPALAGFCAGALGVIISGLLTALSLALTNEGFAAAAWAIFLAHLPIMVVEGILTMLTVSFLNKYRPALICCPHPQERNS